MEDVMELLWGYFEEGEVTALYEQLRYSMQGTTESDTPLKFVIDMFSLQKKLESGNWKSLSSGSTLMKGIVGS